MLAWERAHGLAKEASDLAVGAAAQAQAGDIDSANITVKMRL